MFEKDFSDMNDMDRNGWNDVDGIVDMEGKLRFALEDLESSREKHKKVVEKISYLRSLLDKGKKVIDELEIKLYEKTKEYSKLEEEISKVKEELEAAKDHIETGLKLKGDSEMLDVILNSQR